MLSDAKNNHITNHSDANNRHCSRNGLGRKQMRRAWQYSSTVRFVGAVEFRTGPTTMNTPQERKAAAQAIAAMRSAPFKSQPKSNSRALEIDHYRDAQELKHLEDGEEFEVPSYKLSEAHKINYSQQSIYGARTGKQNSPWQQGCYLKKETK